MADPYVYPGTNVLRNRLGIRDQALLQHVEIVLGQHGLAEFRKNPSKLPIGVPRLKATHKAIFGEVYDWAGEFRENIGAMQKFRPAGYPVVYPPSTFIPQEMDRIFADLQTENNLKGLSLERFPARAAAYYAGMDGTHPFREGNSRTLRQFFLDLAAGAGFALDWGASGVDEPARERLYRARDDAAMQRQPARLAAIIATGLTPL